MAGRAVRKLTIVGGSILGALTLYFAYLEAKAEAKEKGWPADQPLLRVTILDKLGDLSKTTIAEIAPSLTPDEILAVVPAGDLFDKGLKTPFTEEDGIRVSDVLTVGGQNINETDFTQRFIAAVKKAAESQQTTEELLLLLGSTSMELWQYIYETDPGMRAVLDASDFHPCKQLSTPGELKLYDGYRIDALYNMPDASGRGQAMCDRYKKLGYADSQVLSPAQVLELDPTLAEFVANNTDDVVGEQVWKADACAVFRPGGCFNATKFLQHFYEYMGEQLGTYTNEAGKEKPCLRVKTKEVVGVELEATEAADHMRVSGLHVKSPGGQAAVSSAGPDVLVKKNKHTYLKSDYAFCTGEAVGVLDSWGLADPLAARFGGAVLKLHLPMPPGYSGIVPDHCMELHQQGVVLAWQVRPEALADDCPGVFIGVGGTKAYYEKEKPNNEQAFAKFRHPFHLNQVNMMYPELLSHALGRDTRGQDLTLVDLQELIDKGYATRWVGARACAADNFPTVGLCQTKDGRVIDNAATAKDFSSGGGSCATGGGFLATVALSRSRDGFFKPESCGVESARVDVLLERGHPARMQMV